LGVLQSLEAVDVAHAGCGFPAFSAIPCSGHYPEGNSSAHYIIRISYTIHIAGNLGML